MKTLQRITSDSDMKVKQVPDRLTKWRRPRLSAFFGFAGSSLSLYEGERCEP